MLVVRVEKNKAMEVLVDKNKAMGELADKNKAMVMLVDKDKEMVVLVDNNKEMVEQVEQPMIKMFNKKVTKINKTQKILNHLVTNRLRALAVIKVVKKLSKNWNMRLILIINLVG